jgi:ABC-type Na+ efflux pump permease subunit
MEITDNFRLGLAQGRESKTRAPYQLFKPKALQKISTGISLVGLFLGFSIFGILIIVHRHQADLNDLVSGSSAATVGGIISILVGSVFLLSAYFHWKFSPASAPFAMMNPAINQIERTLHRQSMSA